METGCVLTFKFFQMITHLHEKNANVQKKPQISIQMEKKEQQRNLLDFYHQVQIIQKMTWSHKFQKLVLNLQEMVNMKKNSIY